MDQKDKIQEIAEHIDAIINLLGEDTTREGLAKTPIRSAKALYYLTSGYREDPTDILKQAVFKHEGSKMVIVKDIEFYSMCEHHILPFFGKISIGYIPNGKMVGLSKLARIVNSYARRLQVQERLTRQIVDEIMHTLDAKGVIVKCTGAHLCMKMRGVEKQEALTTTVDYAGDFETNDSLREEFFKLLKEE